MILTNNEEHLVYQSCKDNKKCHLKYQGMLKHNGNCTCDTLTLHHFVFCHCVLVNKAQYSQWKNTHNGAILTMEKYSLWKNSHNATILTMEQTIKHRNPQILLLYSKRI